MLIVFIGLNVLLKILRLFDKDKFLLYKMFFVMIKKHYCPVKAGKSVFEIVET